MLVVVLSCLLRLFVITNILILGYYVNQDTRGALILWHTVKYQLQGSF